MNPKVVIIPLVFFIMIISVVTLFGSRSTIQPRQTDLAQETVVEEEVEKVSTIAWGDGGTYSGMLEDGKPHGKGKWLHPDGYYYDGEWINGDMANPEKMIMPDGKPFTPISPGSDEDIKIGEELLVIPGMYDFKESVKEEIEQRITDSQDKIKIPVIPEHKIDFDLDKFLY
jgi:hypothetical protein